MAKGETVALLREKYEALRSLLSERARRTWAASEAMTIGWGGTAAVVEATGMSRNTIRLGMAELQSTQDSGVV